MIVAPYLHFSSARVLTFSILAASFHFAYPRDINIAANFLAGVRPLRDFFDTPDLAVMDDAIVNGTLPALPGVDANRFALGRDRFDSGAALAREALRSRRNRGRNRQLL
jgi:hypothetical protein